MSIIDIYRRKTFDIRLYIEMSIFLCLFTLNSLIFRLNLEYMVLTSLTVLTFEAHKYNKKVRKITNYLLPGLVNLAIIFFVINNHLSILYLPFVGLVLFNIAELYDGKNTKEAFKIVTTLFLVISLIANIAFNYLNPFTNIFLILAIINFFIYGLIDNKNLYKVLSYMILNTFALKLFYNADVEVYYLILPIVTFIITFINLIIEKSKVRDYLVAQYIFAFVFIYIPEVSFHTILFLLALSICYHMFVSNKDSLEKYLPLIALIPLIHIKDSFLTEVNVLLSGILIVSFTLISASKRDVNDWTKISFGYLALHALSFTDQKYVFLILLVFVPLVHTFTTFYKQKDTFMFLTYLFSYILVLNIIYDFFEEYSVILFVVVSTYMLLLTTRTIIKTRTKDYKVLEYIFLSLINLYSVGAIINPWDATLITLFFLVNVIIGYLYKMGPLLMVSLISLLYAVFRLTESFWLSISWWIYVLAIGCILVIFAINNEIKSKENKPKINFDKIKKKFDL